MKRIFGFIFITIVVFMTSCATTAPGVKETFFIDYSRYHRKGFFMTESNSVNFAYTPIGSVVSVTKGAKKAAKLFSTQQEERFTIYDTLDELASQSKRKGADGIINLKIRFTYDKELGEGYEVSGMAIRRQVQTAQTGDDYDY